MSDLLPLAAFLLGAALVVAFLSFDRIVSLIKKKYGSKYHIIKIKRSLKNRLMNAKKVNVGIYDNNYRKVDSIQVEYKELSNDLPLNTYITI